MRTSSAPPLFLFMFTTAREKRAPRLQKRGARVRFRSVLQSIYGAVAITVLLLGNRDYTGAVLKTISNLRIPRAGTDREKARERRQLCVREILRTVEEGTEARPDRKDQRGGSDRERHGHEEGPRKVRRSEAEQGDRFVASHFDYAQEVPGGDRGEQPALFERQPMLRIFAQRLVP